MAARRSLLIAAAAGLLAACGSGLLALLPFVAAIGGSWQGGRQVSNSWVIEPDQSLNFDEPAFPNDLYIGDQAEVAAVLTGVASACGAANVAQSLRARFDGVDFTLTLPGAAAPCLRGTMLDEITLRLDTGGTGTHFRNLRPFDPLFEQGVWTNIHRGEQRLVLRNDRTTVGTVSSQSGCEYTGGTVTGSVALTYRLGDNDAGTLPVIDSIVITRAGGIESWGPGRMAGISGVVIGSGTGDVSLERRNEALAC